MSDFFMVVSLGILIGFCTSYLYHLNHFSALLERFVRRVQRDPKFLNKLIADMDQAVAAAQEKPADSKVRDALVDRHTMELDYEVQAGVHYFYSKRDNSFVCQGSTLEAAARAFKSRFGDQLLAKFVLDGQDHWFVNGLSLDDVDITVTVTEV